MTIVTGRDRPQAPPRASAGARLARTSATAPVDARAAAQGTRIGTTSVGQVPMRRLRSIFDGMFDGVWLVAADGRTTYANGAIAALLGTTRAAMRNRPFVDFVDPDLRPEVDAFLARQRTHAGERMELRLRRVDGGDLFVLLAGSPIRTDGAYVGTMLNVSDVSGKRSIDAQVMQNQRLEAIGQFAGGIAHDFNNLLTSIQGFAELARAGLPDGDPARGDIEQVLVGAQRASAITRRLLAFTRRQVLLPIDVDPGTIMKALLPMLGPLLGGSVRLDLDIAEDHAWVRVDPNQLEQVIVNLAINARDAMPDGGTLSITVRDLGSTDPTRPDGDLTAGPFVRISVRDTGSGMDEATRTRMFDPFFTTKAADKGTGLGLSTVFGVVTQSGGQITVETAPGKGSTFHVDLPSVRPATAAPAEPLHTPAPGRPAVVLLVDDDDGIRAFARRSLEAAGHVVLTAASGREALAAIAASSVGVDVLLTDLVMPGLHGPELARRVREEHPDIGVILASGYSEESATRVDALVELGEFLAKPYSVGQVQQAVARAAEQRRKRSAAAGGDRDEG